MTDKMKEEVSAMLRGIERYNPENLRLLEQYVEYQVRENMYNLEANLAVLKLYQFNPTLFKPVVVVHILLKALTNLPHTDFVLCKCLLDASVMEGVDVGSTADIKTLMNIHVMLETCQFGSFWEFAKDNRLLWSSVNGFETKVREYICHVVNITYQHIQKTTLTELLGLAITPELLKERSWRDSGDGFIFISNQEESIKTKNITEKIDFESVSSVIAAYR
ncbi:Eukaryotic translation initiation factor 3 subunit K [Halotydeus destructor]|nr:Eukaryotic translation initiation factor 3 subunit K [Halotydeus destructor]